MQQQRQQQKQQQMQQQRQQLMPKGRYGQPQQPQQPQQYSPYQMQNPYGPQQAGQQPGYGPQQIGQQQAQQGKQAQQASGARYDPMNTPMSLTMDMPQPYQTNTGGLDIQNMINMQNKQAQMPRPMQEPMQGYKQNPIQEALTVSPQEHRMYSAVMP
jgi:hypothetical protein